VNYFLNASAHSRAVAAEEPDWDNRPRPALTFPGAPRTVLPRGAEITTPLGEALNARRTRRTFTKITAEQAGRLLYAAAGSPGPRQNEGGWVHGRPFPSAGALYPIELYVVIHGIDGLPDGLHHYDPRAHELELRAAGDVPLAQATLQPDALSTASLVVALSAVAQRTTWKYGQRGWRYIWLEAGHIAQNLCLTATALDLPALPVGGFFDREVADVLMLADGETPLYLVAS
jgi:SagB-type dehydrogenase family enzyme